MADIDVILLYNSQFGTEGTGNDNFDQPSGICIVNDKIYVVDKQNHRVKIHELNGVFISAFGSIGSGNDNFFFPECVTSDGTHLYITDSANHRIKKHDLDGVFVSEFGSVGAGDDNFSYPVGINIIAGDLWIADKQNNRVKQHTTAGVFVSQITGFNFPEGVATIDGLVVIPDTTPGIIYFYTTLGDLVRTITGLDHPTQVKETGGILTVVERQASRLVFLDNAGEFIERFGSTGSGANSFLFPSDVVYLDGILYVVDGANAHVQNYEITIEQNIPIFSGLFLRLTKRLYPTGRAWWMHIGGIFEKLHLGLAYSESRIKQVEEALLDSILPDNANFSTTDASNWERALGLYDQADLSLAVRKQALLRKIQFPGEAISRQHFTFLQGELQKAGFDVIVTENRFGDPPAVVNFTGAVYGQVVYAEVNYGQAAIESGDAEILANYIDPAKDASFSFGTPTNLRATWFISADPYPTVKAIDIKRKSEFRELMLRLKPAQTAGFLFVKYVSLSGFTMDSTEITMDSTLITMDKT